MRRTLTRPRPQTLSQAAHRSTAPPPTKREIEYVSRPELVLVVVDGDWLEVFASKAVHLHVAAKPYMGECSTVEAELAAEEYLDVTLPHRYRKLYMPGMLRWQGEVSRITPADIAQRDHDLRLMRAIKEVSQ